MRILRLFLLLAFALASANTFAQKDSGFERVAQANRLYREGQFPQAVDNYSRAISEGLVNGHILYNLGNAYYRQKRYGMAIANYRRALELLPENADVKYNLALARRKTVDKLNIKSLGDDLSSILLAPYKFFTPNQRKFLFLICFAIWAFCLGSARLISKKRILFFASALSLLMLYSGLLAFLTSPGRLGEPRLSFQDCCPGSVPAVIVSKEAMIYSGDSESFQVISILHDGAEILTKETRNAWIQVLLPNNRTGWVKTKDIEVL